MQKWEYTTMVVSRYGSDVHSIGADRVEKVKGTAGLRESLNKLGSEGWELVTSYEDGSWKGLGPLGVNVVALILKKPIESQIKSPVEE